MLRKVLCGNDFDKSTEKLPLFMKMVQNGDKRLRVLFDNGFQILIQLREKVCFYFLQQVGLTAIVFIKCSAVNLRGCTEFINRNLIQRLFFQKCQQPCFQHGLAQADSLIFHINTSTKYNEMLLLQKSGS